MVAVEPVFTTIARKHEAFVVLSVIRLLAVAIDIEERIIINILVVLVIFLDQIGNFRLLICFCLLLLCVCVDVEFCFS